MNETKTGWADKLFAWFSKDVKTTGLVLLTLLSFFLLRRGDKLEAENKKLQEDKTQITTAGLERVIKEVEKRQDPRFKAMESKLDTIKLTNDSSRVDLMQSKSKVDQAAELITNAFKRK